jgi:hypothetical protein
MNQSICGIIAVSGALVLATLTLNLGMAFGEDGKTYRCAALDAAGIQPGGTIEKNDPGAEIHRKRYDKMVVNLATGEISYPSSGVREEWVLQKSSLGDYTLFPSVSLRRKTTAAKATTNFIRLHANTANTSQVTFMAFSLSYLVTGTCDIVR